MKILHVFTLFTTAQSFFDGQFRFLSQNGYELHLICSPMDGYQSFVDRNNVVYKSLCIARNISPLKDLKAVWHICRYIRRNRIKVVMGHTPKGALVAMLAGFIMRVPYRVYYRHGLVYTTAKGLKRLVLKAEERFVSLLATRIVNVSPSLGALAIKDCLNSASKQQIIGAGTCGGIDAINKFNPNNLDGAQLMTYRQHLKLQANDFVVGFCGRLCRDKGIIELIEGVRLFRERHPEMSAKLLLVGGFDLRDILPASVKEQILHAPDIISVGQIRQDIEYYYAMMDIFVFPSYREGFGMSVLEASAMERPILVSKSHGCVDSIRENETGYYIGISPKSICSGIERLTNPETRRKLGQKGRQFVLENYDHTVVWPEVLKFYQSLK